MVTHRRAAQHIRVERVAYQNGVTFLVFDIVARCLLRDVTDFLNRSSTTSLDVKTKEKALYQILGFLEFLRINGSSLKSLTEHNIKQYAEWELKRTKADKSHRDSDTTAKRTVNSKLDGVLYWLSWLKWTSKYSLDGVGLPDISKNLNSFQLSWRSCSSAYFNGVGEKSRHRTGKIPSNDVFDEVLQRVLEGPGDEYAAHRNNLIGKLAKESGMRIESICSLKVKNFPKDKVMECDLEHFLVIPPVQKFNYLEEYKVPNWLAIQLALFIDDHRQNLIKLKNNGTDLSEGYLFLSSKTARPIKSRSVSRIFGDAMKASGAPKGLAIHVFRKLMATKKSKEESRRRAKAGLDTSTASVAAAVSRDLGQTNPRSLAPYVTYQQSTLSQEQEAKDQADTERTQRDFAQALEANKELTAEVIRLQQEIHELKSRDV